MTLDFLLICILQRIFEILPTNVRFSFPLQIAAICTMDKARKNSIGKRPPGPMIECSSIVDITNLQYGMADRTTTTRPIICKNNLDHAKEQPYSS